MTLYNLACSVPWAIQPDWLATVLDVLSRDRLSGDELASHLEAVAARLGRPLDNTQETTLRGSVAVVPVLGVIARRADWFTQISGGVSVEALALDIRTAIDDPKVSSIVLEIDSPGGEINGVGELAAMIHEMTWVKPIVAYVGHQAASAAYYLASAASEIVIAPSAMLGSIGVVSVHKDTKARDEKSGVRKIELVSSQSPRKRPDLDTEAGRTQIQALIDSLADVFIADVATYRDTTSEAVEADFGAGDMLVGQAAVDAGMADILGSLESVISHLNATAWGVSRPVRSTRSAGPAAQDDTMDFKAIKAWFGAGMPDDFDPANPQTKATEPATKPQAAKLDPDPEVARLKAEVARLTSDSEASFLASLESESARFVADHAKQIAPVERPHVLAAFRLAMKDDKANPVAAGEKSRVETLKASVEARPASQWSREVTTGGLPEGTRTVASTAEPEDEMKAEYDQASRWAESRNGHK